MEDTNLTTPIIQTPKTNWLLLLLAGVIILVIGIGIGLMLGKYLSKQISSYEDCMKTKGSGVQESNPPTCVTANGLRFKGPVASPTLTPDPTANWKIYSNEQFGFTIHYPAEWQIEESHNPVKEAPFYGSKTSDSVKFFSDTGYIQFFTGVEFETSYPTQQRIRVEPMTLSGKNLEKEIYSVSGQKTETMKVVIKIPNSTPFRIDALFQSADSNIIDQILSTFKFIERTFCGGFTGTPCPEGYECKYEPNSDGGYCIKN